MRTVEVSGSWGLLEVCPVTGVIVEAHHEPIAVRDLCQGEIGYRNIKLFDVTVFQRMRGCDAFDILSCGYWLGNGDYAEPLTQRMVWDQDWPRDRGLVDFDDWVELRLLPAPEQTVR